MALVPRLYGVYGLRVVGEVTDGVATQGAVIAGEEEEALFLGRREAGEDLPAAVRRSRCRGKSVAAPKAYAGEGKGSAVLAHLPWPRGPPSRPPLAEWSMDGILSEGGGRGRFAPGPLFIHSCVRGRAVRTGGRTMEAATRKRAVRTEKRAKVSAAPTKGPPSDIDAIFDGLGGAKRRPKRTKDEEAAPPPVAPAQRVGAAKQARRKHAQAAEAQGPTAKDVDRERARYVGSAGWREDGLGGVINEEGWTGRRTGDGMRIFKTACLHQTNKKCSGGTPLCPFDCDCCWV